MAKLAILILVNMEKPGAGEQAESLRGWLEQRVELLGVYPHSQALPADAARAKLCVVFGGDGTLLSAGRKIAPLGIPLLGVNMGKLGFLAEFNVEHFKRHLDEILAGDVKPTERIMLSVRLVDGGEDFSALASNDVSISAGDPFRMIDLRVARGEQQISRYLGDGLVVSTPTGSTGYNLSAGGPILQPSLDAVVITPVAPHTLSVRPIVLRAELPIRITATGVNEGTKMVIDGQVSRRLCDGNVVEVSRAPQPMLIIPHPGRSYFQTLSDKLHWGQSPHHNGTQQGH